MDIQSDIEIPTKKDSHSETLEWVEMMRKILAEKKKVVEEKLAQLNKPNH